MGKVMNFFPQSNKMDFHIFNIKDEVKGRQYCDTEKIKPDPYTNRHPFSKYSFYARLSLLSKLCKNTCQMDNEFLSIL